MVLLFAAVALDVYVYMYVCGVQVTCVESDECTPICRLTPLPPPTTTTSTQHTNRRAPLPPRAARDADARGERLHVSEPKSTPKTTTPPPAVAHPQRSHHGRLDSACWAAAVAVAVGREGGARTPFCAWISGSSFGVWNRRVGVLRMVGGVKSFISPLIWYEGALRLLFPPLVPFRWDFGRWQRERERQKGAATPRHTKCACTRIFSRIFKETTFGTTNRTHPSPAARAIEVKSHREIKLGESKGAGKGKGERVGMTG